MKPLTIVISINASWNIINFRQGLVRALQNEGHRVFALAPPDAWSGRFAALGVGYLPIKMDKKGISPLADLALLWRYWRALRRLRPDIFLGYTVKPNVYGSLAAQVLGARVINNVSGLGTAFIRQGALRTIVSWLYRVAFRRSSTVFFQNEEDQALFVGEHIVEAEKARLLPGSGVDLERFKPAPPPRQTARPFTFLLIGRLLRDKGVGEYVEAARLVRRARADVRFQLMGFLDAENRTAISRSDVDKWVAEGIVDYLGDVDDVRPAIGSADCIVLPSYREGLPRTLLEAAAMTRPLIATDVPGCRQVVRHGSNGFLCRVQDPGALADAMLTMLSAPPEQRRMWGEAGRAMVEAEYDERIVVERYLAAIETAGI